MKSFSAIYIAILITHNLVCIINSSPCTRRQRELREAESYDLTAISTAPTQPSRYLNYIKIKPSRAESCKSVFAAKSELEGNFFGLVLVCKLLMAILTFRYPSIHFQVMFGSFSLITFY